MSDASLGWETLLDTDAPGGASLKAALLTTYDRADERLLVEHLLPALLKLGYEPSAEGRDSQCFLLELDRRLRQLHDRLIVVSSMLREESPESEPDDGTLYPWLWGYIRHLVVGSRNREVQHAKLWMFHWGAAEENGPEYLELVVSSANLTLAAFKGQIQAAWRVCVELRPLESEGRKRGWGVLPEFLSALAASSGDRTRLESFVRLLGRAECPDGVTFVASVPGTHTRQTLRRSPWGAAGLRAVTPGGRGNVRVSILSPYVGSWNTKSLRSWVSRFSGALDRLELVWIDWDHPWARDKRWLLPKRSLEALARDGRVLHFRGSGDKSAELSRFHEEHVDGDDRWGHAKVYAFQRGNSRRVLITSANFSTAAWGRDDGDGNLVIDNFELGVCVGQGVWPFDDLEDFENLEQVATVSGAAIRSARLITWFQASWDGLEVRVDCRCQPGRELSGEVIGGSDSRQVGAWTTQSSEWVRSARVSWGDTHRIPSVVRLRCEGETVLAPVFDARPLEGRESLMALGVSVRPTAS